MTGKKKSKQDSENPALASMVPGATDSENPALASMVPFGHAVMIAVLSFVMALPTGYFGYMVIPYNQSLVDQQQIVAFDDRYHTVREVKDGDSLLLESGETVRLIGIDAPELRGQECYAEQARQALLGLVIDQQIILDKDEQSIDEFGRLLRYVHIYKPDRDEGLLHVNRELLRQGYAMASPVAPNRRYQPNFKRAENEAREKMRGIWEECPELVAKELRQEDIPAPSTECVIKGNVSESSGNKTYWLPHCGINYERAKIDPNRGEQWFCSIQEAQEAGFEIGYNCTEQ